MLPTTAASVADGVIAFMNAAFGLRFAPDFFAAAFFAGAFLAAFFGAGFLAAFFADFLAGFFADFLAPFLAVAMVLLPVCWHERTTRSVLKRWPSCRGRRAPSAATIPHFPCEGTMRRGIFHSVRGGVATVRRA